MSPPPIPSVAGLKMTPNSINEEGTEGMPQFQVDPAPSSIKESQMAWSPTLPTPNASLILSGTSLPSTQRTITNESQV